MSRKEKALARLMQAPRDFTWDELNTVMSAFGFALKTTGGSGRKFIHRETGVTLFMHEPHPSKVLNAYQVREAMDLLKKEGFVK
ncbi:MAG: type II toxin-antitoxin system HicA family toxin [Candidatus Binataceae bacterium]